MQSEEYYSNRVRELRRLADQLTEKEMHTEARAVQMAIVDINELSAKLRRDEEIIKEQTRKLPSVQQKANVMNFVDRLKEEIEDYKSKPLSIIIGVEDLQTGKELALDYVLSLIDRFLEGIEK